MTDLREDRLGPRAIDRLAREARIRGRMAVVEAVRLFGRPLRELTRAEGRELLRHLRAWPVLDKYRSEFEFEGDGDAGR